MNEGADMTATATQPTGCAPDSVYASWSRAERAASDRIEAERNQQDRTALARRDAAEGHPISLAPDDSLRRLAKAYRRDLEDIADGDLHPGRKAVITARLRDIEREQDFRATLRECWLAAEDGTHSYTAFHARGGLEAVLDHGAPAPSYQLAMRLDQERQARGLTHVFEWDLDPAWVAMFPENRDAVPA